MSLVRSKASELGIDPKRIGILGFSAGGHLAAATCLKYEQRQYDKLDAIDEVSCRPDFGVLIYPGLPRRQQRQVRPEYQPTKANAAHVFCLRHGRPRHGRWQSSH